MIEHDQLEAMGNAIIPRNSRFSGNRFESFKELATAAKAHGSLIAGQVSHPGRQSPHQIQKNPISASDVQLEGSYLHIHRWSSANYATGKVMGMQFAKPHPASQEEINNVIDGLLTQQSPWKRLATMELSFMALTATCLRNSFLLQRISGQTNMVALSKIVCASSSKSQKSVASEFLTSS
jgi:hypothetical protein